MVVRRGLLLALLLTVTGCGGGSHPAPSSAAGSLLVPPPPSATGRPRLAHAGTACGQVTTLEHGHARVVISHGSTTCDEAQRVFQTYFDPNTPAEGVAGLVVIDHWTCGTSGTVTTCTLRDNAIEARG